MEAGRRNPLGQPWWFDALLVAVIALAAFIASDDARILPAAAIVVGLLFVGLRLLLRSGLGRILSTRPLKKFRTTPNGLGRRFRWSLASPRSSPCWLSGASSG